MPHSEGIVTEAKFVINDALGGACNQSAKQLVDTLSQLTEALDGVTQTIDQDIWLARLSDLLVLQNVAVPGKPALDTAAWRRAIRGRECSFRIWGYSHVFVYAPQDFTAHVTSVKGIQNAKTRGDLNALQEIFGPGHVRELFLQYHAEDHKATTEMRIRNGHPAFGLSKRIVLTPKPS